MILRWFLVAFLRLGASQPNAHQEPERNIQTGRQKREIGRVLFLLLACSYLWVPWTGPY